MVYILRDIRFNFHHKPTDISRYRESKTITRSQTSVAGLGSWVIEVRP